MTQHRSRDLHDVTHGGEPGEGIAAGASRHGEPSLPTCPAFVVPVAFWLRELASAGQTTLHGTGITRRDTHGGVLPGARCGSPA